jgi:parallel beta-helix repeat protein
MTKERKYRMQAKRVLIPGHGRRLLVVAGAMTVLAMACCSPVRAAEPPARVLCVAQQDPAASDENAGTLERPWKTIARSLTTLKAGDTLYVRTGTYREMIMLASNGWTFAGITAPPFAGGRSHAEPVRFVAWPGEEVVIKASDAVTGWKPHAGAVWVHENWTHNSQQVFCDEAPLQQIGGTMPPLLMEYWRGAYRDKIFGDLMPGSFFYDREQKKLFVWLKDSGDPNVHLMEAGVRPFLFTIGVDFVQVSGFKMRHGNACSIVNWASVQLGGAFDVLENCEVTWCDYIAVGLSGRNNIVRGCVLNHNGNAGLAGGGWGNQLLDSQLSYNNTRHWSSGWGAGGMKVIPGAHNWVVSGCVAEYNHKSDGIWFDAYNANILIQNCIMRHNDGAGLHYEISERAIIRNNIAYENKGPGIYLSNSSRSIVLHNLCYRNGMSGIIAHGVNRQGGSSADPETGFEPARDVVVWGNILMDNCHPDLCPRVPDHTGRPWTLRPELILPDPRIKSNAGCVSDYNVFYRSDGRSIEFWENFGGGMYADLKEWQEKSGQDRHSLIAEPRFVNLAARDFRPAADSPAIGLVRPQMSVSQDRMFRDAFLTAGPHEVAAPPRAKPRPSPATNAVLRAVELPNAAALPGDRPLASLAALCATIPPKPLPSGKAGIELKGIPYAWGAAPQVLVLDRRNPRVIVPVNARVKELHFLHALVNPGTGVQSRVMIMRQDGHALHLTWEADRNIATSLGAWSGSLTNSLSAPIGGWVRPEDRSQPTDVAWEGPAGGTPGRVFASTWKNENEWLPVREVEWTLVDESATVVILGITGRMLD